MSNRITCACADLVARYARLAAELDTRQVTVALLADYELTVTGR